MEKHQFLTDKMKIIITTVMFVILTLTIMSIGIIYVLKQDKNGNEFKAVYIHFNCFYNSNDCCWFIDSIRENYYENVPCDKYDKSKMWSVYINTGKKHVNKGLLPKKCLNLDLLNVEVFNNEIPFDY